RGESTETVPPQVISTTPAVIEAASSTSTRVTQVAVAFSEELNAIDANAPANYELRGAGPDGIFGTPDDVLYVLTPQYTSGNPVVTLAIGNGSLPEGLYRFTIASDQNSSVHDLAGNRLDGDADGQEGGAYVRTFRVAQITLVPAAGLSVAEGGFSGTVASF